MMMINRECYVNKAATQYMKKMLLNSHQMINIEIC